MRSDYDFSNAIKGKYVGRVDTGASPTEVRKIWHHPSVKLIMGQGDPIETVVESARQLVLQAADAGLLTVPIDPFKLAELKGIPVIPKPDVADAQLVPGPGGKPVIHYNPSRPRARVRFSICHELGHTLFPDCLAQVRHRLFHSRTSPIDYELEALCNLAAAELLLPLGSIQEDMAKLKLSVDTALRLREKYEASTEAVLLRLIGLSGVPCAVFAAAPEESSQSGERNYRIEYVRAGVAWDSGVRRGQLLPITSVIRDCTSIGFTARGTERWIPDGPEIDVDAVGVSPYPNRGSQLVRPRVTGLIRPAGQSANDTSPIRLVRGNALEPRGDGIRIVAHVVNNQTPNWGAGFGRALQRKWPSAQRHFSDVFLHTHGSKFDLTCSTEVEDGIFAFQMVAQRGYGPSGSVRLRYESLRNCLAQLRQKAIELNATVHMPRIGTGEAGGSWGLIANLIIEELCTKGVPVTVYELPTTTARPSKQSGLFDEISI
jgi:Zn-dependent peptidase ImmA (M78 family)